MSRFIWTILCVVVFCSNLWANDVRIKGEVKVQVLDASTALITFPLSWDHSWREGENWDAVWIFIKYKRKGVNEPWHHAYLKESGHKVTGRNDIPPMEFWPVYTVQNWEQQQDILYFGNDVANSGGTDKKVIPGLFLYRKKAGTGNIEIPRVSIEWDFNEGDLNLYHKVTPEEIKNGEIELSAQAIEMVYVPVGPYYLGDRSSAGSFVNEKVDDALRIVSDDAQTLYRMGNTGASTYDAAWEVPEQFPMGYTGFYVMKYEVSQEQYVNFLNRLTLRDQVKRIGRPLSSLKVGDYVFGATANQEDPSFRNGIILMEKKVEVDTPAVFGFNLGLSTPYNHPDDGKSVPCNFLSPADMKAYLDWAGLRPFAETEYEKACRERNPASFYVNKSYAWETPTMTSLTWASVTEPGKETEHIVSSANVNGPISAPYAFPVKCGIFANETPSMMNSGASRWGIMELTGNLAEMYYNAETARNFNGEIFGDGNIWSTPSTWKDSVVTLSKSVHVGWGWHRVHLSWTIPYTGVMSKKGNPMVAEVRHWVDLYGEYWRGTTHNVTVQYAIPFPTISWPDTCNAIGIRGGSFESATKDEMAVSYRGQAAYFADKSMDSRLKAIGFRGGRAVPVRGLSTGIISGQNLLQKDTVIACSGNIYTIIERVPGEDDPASTIYSWEINDGSGWKEIPGKNDKDLPVDWILNDSVPWHEYAFRRHSVASHAEGYSNEVVLCVPGVTVADNKKELRMGEYVEFLNLNVQVGGEGDVKVEWLDDETTTPGVWYTLANLTGVSGNQTVELNRHYFDPPVTYGDAGVLTLRTTVKLGGCSFENEYTLSMEPYAYATPVLPVTDARNGKTYQTAALSDSRTWMIENLEYDVPADGAGRWPAATGGNYTLQHIQAAVNGWLQLCPDGYELPGSLDMDNVLKQYWVDAGSGSDSDGYPYYEKSDRSLYGPPLDNFVNAFFGITGGMGGLTAPYISWWTGNSVDADLYSFKDSGWGYMYCVPVTVSANTVTGKVRCVKKK